MYLLTAAEKLWKATESAVGKAEITFENIHLKNGSKNAYALYCAAKDLCNGSPQLYIDDIADSDIIKGKVFNLICNAMIVKRVGCLDGLYALFGDTIMPAVTQKVK